MNRLGEKFHKLMIWFCSIMKVSAVDKGTGKSESVTIENERGRLSQEEIDRVRSFLLF